MKRISLLFLFAVYSCSLVAQPKVVISESNKENAYPRLSKDAKKIIYQSNRTGAWQLFIYDIPGKKSERVTNNKFNDNFPDWSADNKWIAFVSDRSGNEDIYLMRTDGSGLRQLTDNTARDIHPYFSPDGKCILFNSDREENQFDIYRYTIATGKTERITHTPENETCARYAPDMKDIVYLKNSEAADDIYLLHSADASVHNLSKSPHINHGWPVFNSTGEWVYYSSMENGSYSIYRTRRDGSKKQQVTNAPRGEEHARVNLSHDNTCMVYNIKTGSTISIVLQKLI